MNNLREISRTGGCSCGALVPSSILDLASIHQSFHGVLPVNGGRMAVSHRPLNCPAANEWKDCARIDSGHHKSRGEGVPVAMHVRSFTSDARTVGSNQVVGLGLFAYNDPSPCRESRKLAHIDIQFVLFAVLQ